MIFSVWNNGSRTYSVYETADVPAIHAEAPPRAATNQLGATPEQAAWPLPAGARLIGTSEIPRGRIAATPGSARVVTIGAGIKYGVVMYILWRAFR